MPSISIPAALAIGGAALGAGSSIIGGISQAHAASYQAQIANNNAIAERQNAAHAAQAETAQAEQAGLKARAQNAGVRAAIAANNLDVSTGSPVDVQESQHKIGMLDTATVANRGAEQVYGYETQATGQEAQSNLYASEVGPDILGGVLKGGGSLLSGLPSVPGAYQWMSGDSGSASAGGGGDFSQFGDLAG